MKHSRQQWLRNSKIGFQVVQGYIGNMWWLLGLNWSWNSLRLFSGITVDRHQWCNNDRQSFISLTASSREAEWPLFGKTGITAATGCGLTSNRWHWKANSTLYFVSKDGLNLTVGRSPSIARHLTRLCSITYINLLRNLNLTARTTQTYSQST